jgi:tripeptide aminopeptidase
MQNLLRVIDLAIAIQQIPAPTFHEERRADFVMHRFMEEELKDVEMDSLGNVFARFPAKNSKDHTSSQPVVVSAHLDTVFPDSVDLKYERDDHSIHAPGIGDNSLGVAGLFGLVWALCESGVGLPGDLWLVANVCEEGLGDLRGMKAVIERFNSPEEKNSSPLAYIVIEGMSLGNIYHRALGVLRYRVSVKTKGGHSWHDYGQPSAIHALTELSRQILQIPVPASPRTSLNIGIISGGSSINTIAAEAMIELDLRSEGGQELEKLARKVEDIVRIANKPGVTAEAEVIGRRPAGEIPADHPLVRLAKESLRSVGIEPRLQIGSTDANLALSMGLPCVVIGITTGGGAHTVLEHINLDPIEKGMEQLVRLVSGVWI